SIAARRGTCAARCGDEMCWRGSEPCESWSGGRVSAPKSGLPCCWLVPLQDFRKLTEELILLGVSGSGQRKGRRRRPRNPAGLEGGTAKVCEPPRALGVGGRQQHKTAC